MTARFIVADVFDGLATLETGSVDLVITSPPFLALRSYLPADHSDKSKEIGSEATPAEFIDVLLRVTAELRRVLAPHGSICIELGDTYAGSGGAGGDYGLDGWRSGQPSADGSMKHERKHKVDGWGPFRDEWDGKRQGGGAGWPLAKSRTLIPSLYEIALAYGINPLTGTSSPAGQWRIRNIITWARPNPPVGALGDKWRPATSDLIVACTSSKRYWDDLATRKPHATVLSTTGKPVPRSKYPDGQMPSEAAGTTLDYRRAADDEGHPRYTPPNPSGAPLLDYWEIPLSEGQESTRIREALIQWDAGEMLDSDIAWLAGAARAYMGFIEGEMQGGSPLLDYWVIPPGGYQGAHYAVFPQELVVPCVQAMAPPKVCQTCGQPSRRIVEHFGRERWSEPPTPTEFGQALTQALEASGITHRDLASELGVDEALIRHYLGKTGNRNHRLPSLRQWKAMSNLLPFSEDVVAAMATVPPEYETVTRNNQTIPMRLSGGPIRGDLPKMVATGWSDCGHDNWRPALILDCFGGSGTTGVVATGYGHDCVLIDLDERNCDLARDRIGPFMFEGPIYPNHPVELEPSVSLQTPGDG